MSRGAGRGVVSIVRIKPFLWATLILGTAFLAFRTSTFTSTYEVVTTKDERLSHLLSDHSINIEGTEGFSPLKGLGLEDWVVGPRKRLLILGGSHPLGQSIVPKLLHEYEVYIFDTQLRPSSLPISPHIHYHTPTTTSVPSLLSQFSFNGIVELNGVGLSDKCHFDQERCFAVYTSGVSELLAQISQNVVKSWWKGTRGSPWMLLASESLVMDDVNSVDLFSSAQATVEEQLKTYLDFSASPGQMYRPKEIIARFGNIYSGSVESSSVISFTSSALSATAISALTIYDSDQSPLDLVHLDDAATGLLSTIQRLETGGLEDEMEEFDFVSGQLTSQREFVDLARSYAGSTGPLKDLGRNQARSSKWSAKDFKRAKNVLGWESTLSLSQGMQQSLKEIYQANLDWATRYIETECSTTSLPLTPASPASILGNIKNKDLWRLDGCAVNIGFDREGFLDYMKCPVNGTRCTVDNKKVVSYNWGADVFIIKSKSRSHQDRKVSVSFEEEKGRGTLGLSLDGNTPTFALYDAASAKAKTVFDLDVQHDQSYLRFTIPNDGHQIKAVPDVRTNTTIFRLATPDTFDVRLNVLCCPTEGDWPLLQDDYESSDIRFGSTGNIPFNASRRSYTCKKAEEAVTYNQMKLKELIAAVPTTQHQKLSTLPNSWAMKDLPACWNDCSAPTICVYTGTCRCVEPECPSKRSTMNPSHNAQKHNQAKLKSALGIHSGFSPNLVNDVKNGNWSDVLLPSFRAYLEKHGTFPSLHVVTGYPGEEAIESAECHKLAPKHCFSADNILYRAMRHLSVPADQADLIVLPVYQHCEGAKFLLHDVMHYAAESIPGIKTGEKKVACHCVDSRLGDLYRFCLMWSARENHALYPDWILNNMLVWSVMGDYDSPCYRPHQDIVIPPRTCPTPLLRETFGDIKQVMPARDRPKLVTWAGTYWGTGKSERLRLTCDRGGAGERELVKGGGPQSVWYNWDYMKSLGTARFCPQPRGIAGWSPRVNDAIYAGCIPVLIAEGTHYPLNTALDWTKFSVRLLPTDLDRIEQILAAIPIEKVEEMQRNLMLVREGFLYSTDEGPEEELERRGPMFWALHAAGMKMGVEFPTG